jgi:hypothetical protein
MLTPLHIQGPPRPPIGEPTAKPRAVFVFGNHGYSKSELRPDKGRGRRIDLDFFKDKVGSALKSAIDEGRQAICIHEMVIFPERWGPEQIRKPDFLKGLDKLKQRIAKAQDLPDLSLGRLDEGHVTKKRLPLDDLDGFGIINDILALNRIRAGSVMNYHEPQDAEATLDSIVSDFWWEQARMASILFYMDGGGIAAEAIAAAVRKSIRLNIRSIIKRDALVEKLADGLTSMEPNTTLVIPRGLMHQHMVRLYNPDIFDIETHCTAFPENAFNILTAKALEEHYSGTLSDARLTEIAAETTRILMKDAERVCRGITAGLED